DTATLAHGGLTAQRNQGDDIIWFVAGVELILSSSG
ncbi:unnamed protein product, partial [Ectocarpus sp. 13 AM-2016]